MACGFRKWGEIHFPVAGSQSVINFAHSSHKGRGRSVPPKPLFHESVRMLLEKPGPGLYKPQANYEPGTEIYVT